MERSVHRLVPAASGGGVSLSRCLPRIIDHLPPQGRLPSDKETARMGWSLSPHVLSHPDYLEWRRKIPRLGQRGGCRMKRCLPALVVATLLVPWTAAAEDNVEFAFMPETKTVTLLNEGGKYVAIDLKHIPE